MFTRLVHVFIILTVCIGLAGYFYYKNQKKHLTRDIKNQLSAIADLKVSQIDAWRKERIADVTSISRNSIIAEHVQEFLNDPDKPRGRQELLAWLMNLKELYDYTDILIIDRNNHVRLATNDNGIGTHARKLVQTVLQTREPRFSDFHKASVVTIPHLDLATPLLLRKGKEQVPVAAILFRIDPSQFLYPHIQTWPVHSRTAETLLIRRDSNDVLFLNELRHRKNTTLSLRIPLSRKELPGVMAVLGKQGVVEGIDYRDVPVLAVIRSVPDTGWFLVSKVDIEEVYAPIRERAKLIAVVIIILIASAGLSVGLRWRRAISEYYRKQYETEVERQALSARCDYLSRYANDIILHTDSQGNILDANDRAIKSYGYPLDELLRLTIRDLSPAGTSDGIENRMEQVRERNGFVFETMHQRKDGSAFPVEISSRAIEIQGTTSYQSIIRDITERKQAEKKILHANRLYAVLSQINQTIVHIRSRDELFSEICRISIDLGGFQMAWIGMLDTDTGFLRSVAHCGAENDNTPVCVSHGNEDGGLIGNAIREGRYFICNDIRNNESMAAWREHAEQGDYQSSGAFPIKMGSSAIGSFNVYSAEPNFFTEDENKLLEEITQDISFALETMEKEEQRHLTEQALIESELRYRSLFDHSLTGFALHEIVTDEAGIPVDYIFIEANQAFETMTGMKVKDIIGKPVTKVLPGIEKTPFIGIYGRIALTGEPLRFEQYSEPLQRYFDIAAYSSKKGFFATVFSDITDRKTAEKDLSESEKRYKRLVESVTDYIYTVTVENGNAVATKHGPGCLAVTGYRADEFDADPNLWYRIIHEEDRTMVIDCVAKVLSGKPIAQFEHRLVHKNGSLRWVKNTPVLRLNNNGQLVDYEGLITDITPVKQLEAQLRQAQKMEAVGQLAGGVAHDFNNILTAIIGYGNLLLLKMPENESLRGYVDQILASSERAANLTHSLLAFSRKQIINLKPIEINGVIRRVGRLLDRLIGEDIEFKTELAEQTIHVLADSVQIEQSLMNLTMNARDAMPEGGILTIISSVFDMGEEFLRTHGFGRPGQYAFISVSDTGVGMDEKIRSKIFEPFFTTKDVGQGTGLGLSIVYGIVKQHNGYITVSSEPGKGSTFTIYLPLIAGGDEEVTKNAPLLSHRGNECVLLAEDDKEVRTLTKAVLENFGYKVIEAVDGEDAVEKFREHRETVEMLIADVMMPKKNGREAYQEIRKTRPDLKVLFMSGYTADAVHKKGFVDPDLDFVLKPISPSDFLKKVREVLDK